MSGSRIATGMLAPVLALYVPLCTPKVAPSLHVPPVPASALWVEPHDLSERDLYYGEWGAERAPAPDATFVYLRAKTGGANPGVVVRDPAGREWSVKQPIHTDQGAEGPVEVVLSRVLSAVGYHQPAVYYLPAFTMKTHHSTRLVSGGRFRLRDRDVKDRGPWSWQRNPFVGTRAMNGLLVILLMFRSSDLKNDNNTLYEVRRGDLIEQWYVVRDLGAALGETGRFAPDRNNIDVFERQRFVLDIRRGFVAFDYHGFHQELVRDRITPDDVRWAGELLARLHPRQWSDAFRAAGYPPGVADRFIRKMHATIDQARRIGGDGGRPAAERR